MIPLHLPGGVACRVYFQPTMSERPIEIDVPEPADVFEILNRAARRLGLPVDESKWREMERRRALVLAAERARLGEDPPAVAKIGDGATPFDREPPRKQASPRSPAGSHAGGAPTDLFNEEV